MKPFRAIVGYFTVLYLLIGLGSPYAGVAYTPIQYLLKDELKLSAASASLFQLVVAIPLYGAFLIGFVRDRWSPLNRRDRGYFAIFGPACALAYATLAWGPVRERTLLFGVLAASASSLFLAGSLQALTAIVGQERRITGRLATLFQLVGTTLWGFSFVAGGFLQTHVSPKQLFAGLAVLMMLFVPVALWQPEAVYGGAVNAPTTSSALFPELWRFLRHRPMWPAAIIWLLWSFAPGFFTPLFFHLTNTLHATPEQYGLFMALFAFSFVPTLFLYGWLCKRVTLQKLLWWSTLLAIPQMLPMLLVNTTTQALWIAPILGLVGGVPTGAYMDLLFRACPKGLEGAGSMMNQTGYFIAVRFGDLLGSWLYDLGGFSLAVWVTVAVYVLILPVLLLVPKEVIERADASVDGAPEAAPIPAPG